MTNKYCQEKTERKLRKKASEKYQNLSEEQNRKCAKRPHKNIKNLLEKNK